MTIKAVIFDKDGVFIESFNTVYAAMNQALTHFGYLELSRLELRKEWWGIRADLSLEKNLGIRSDEAVEIF